MTTRIGEILHADLCGPLPEKSITGARYFLLIKDDFSHYRQVYFLSAKSDVESCLQVFVKRAEKHCPRGVEIFRSDNGLEFINHTVSDIMNKFGIIHQKSVVYCPEQNGKIERENRTIVEAARTMLYSVNFHRRFWAEAVNTAVFVLNCTGNSSVADKSPYELWHGKKPDIKKSSHFW